VHHGVTRLLVVSGQEGWAQAHGAFASSFKGTPVVARHVHRPLGHFFSENVFNVLRAEMHWVHLDAPSWYSDD
jgi:hypothetical protein